MICTKLYLSVPLKHVQNYIVKEDKPVKARLTVPYFDYSKKRSHTL